MNAMLQSGIAAYAQANTTKPRTELVVVLYDGVVRHLMEARQAYEAEKRAETARRLNKASNILEGLRQNLRDDYSPDLCKQLNRFYALSSKGISKQVQNKFEDKQFRSLLSNIRTVRNAWAEVAGVKQTGFDKTPKAPSAPSINVAG